MTPSLRSQLLRVDKDTSRRKVDFLWIFFPWIFARPSGVAEEVRKVIAEYLACAVDALRTDRSYRAGLDRDTIAAMMMVDSGISFEPALLSAFFELVVPRAASA